MGAKPFIDFSGKQFGRLTAMWPAARGKGGMTHWMCSCECGVYALVRGTHLPHQQSCGCQRLEVNTIHNLSHTPEHDTYLGAKKRCTNPKTKCWNNYGGRGIEFRFASFAEFLGALGPRPSPQHSINRIDNDGHYEPGNVHWATAQEQQANKRPRAPYARKITPEQRRQIARRYKAGERSSQLAREFGINRHYVNALVRKSA